ncbi:uncharacterized protein [Miscanthus floridulus]|uniref:uncharacterized protein n=1 Tax=Miscanthus floridulus TaxID=154761 RepID=UPI00345AD3FA
MGRGPLDHLPDVGETVLGASTSVPVLPRGGGGATSGPAITCPRAEADTLEARALGKHAISPVGSTTVVEQVAARATQLPPQRTEGAPGSVEDRPAPADTEVMPLSPPPPSQKRVAVPKRRKRPAEVPTLVPLKALKEPAAQGGAAEATPTQTGEGAPLPREAKAHDSDGAEAPSVAEATKVEALWASEAEATEVGAPRIAEAAAAGAGAPGTIEATMVEAGAPETTEADVITVKPSAQEVEMKAAEASVAPLVQGPPPLWESA